MMKSDLFSLLLASMEDVGRVFDHAETSTWPSGELDALRGLGLIKEATVGLHAPCPNCDDGHIEPVTIRREKDGTPRFFIHCPESMRVEVRAGMCNGWEVDLDGLAKALSESLDLKPRPKALMPGRLWRLGRIPWKTTTREVVLAIRLNDVDAATITTHMGSAGREIIFVPHRLPDERIWPSRSPAVVALSRVATVDDRGFVVDAVAMYELVEEADTATDIQTGLSLDAISSKKVKRHVKSTIESMVSNEALVQAYRVHNSYRKAADAMNKQGFKTDRWAIERAVKAAGGPKAVKNEADSASVARSVASQRRDRGEKFLKRR